MKLMENKNDQMCEKLKTLLPLYLSDELGEWDKKEVEKHIHECESCKQLFDNKEDEILMQGNKELTKSFKRLNSKFIRTVAYIVIGCLLIFNLFVALLPFVTKEAFKEQEVSAKKVQLYDLLLRTPLVDYISVTSNVGLLDTSISCKYNVSFLGNQYAVIENGANIPHFWGKAKFRYDAGETYSINRQYNSYFYIMSSIHNRANSKVKESLTSRTNKGWAKLSDLPKGTLSQVAIYFNNSPSVDDMINLINGVGDVRLDKCWFCIDTRRLERKSGPMLWGFSTLILQHQGEEYIPREGNRLLIIPRMPMSSGGNRNYETDDIKEMASLFQSEMKEYEKHVSGLKNYFSGNGTGYEKEDLQSDLRFMNKQIENEGIKIQSCILAAPTENILKLKENSNIKYMNIVGVGFDSYIGGE